MNEKIKTQQLSNDLEKLTSELDRIGLDKEKLLQQELSADERSALLHHRKHLEPTLASLLRLPLGLHPFGLLPILSRYH